MEAFALKRTGDDDYPKFIKGLLLGPPKSGKTTFLSTLPNPIIADVEAQSGGLQSIAHLDIPNVTIDHSSKLDTLHTILKDDTLRAKAAADLGRPSIQSVAIDTLDALQELHKKERMKSERRQSFQRDDWGWLLEQFQELIRSFTSLPMNVIFTVHTKTVQDDESRLVTMPALQGAIQDQIAGMVGFSLKSERTVEIDQTTGQKKSVYTILTEGDEKNPHLGNRSAGRLPRVITPDFQVLYDAVYQGVQIAKAQRVEVQTPVPGITEVAAAAPAETPPPAEPVAQSSGQEVPQTAAVAAEAQEAPAGAPRDDSGDPINSAALQHLTKMASEFGVDLSPAVKEWTLGQARDVARYVVACKTDAANGDSDQDELKSTVLDGLIGLGAVTATQAAEVVIAGTIDEVVDWAKGSADRIQAALTHEQAKGDEGKKGLVSKLKKLAEKAPDESGQASEPEQTSAPEPSVEPEAQKADDEGTPEAAAEADAAPEPETEAAPAAPEAPAALAEEHPEPPTPEEAAELIKSELGGTELTGKDIPEEMRPCDVCGKSKSADPDDFDIDIARLSEVRFKQWLCVSDYMALVQQKKSATA